MLMLGVLKNRISCRIRNESDFPMHQKPAKKSNPPISLIPKIPPISLIPKIPPIIPIPQIPPISPIPQILPIFRTPKILPIFIDGVPRARRFSRWIGSTIRTFAASTSNVFAAQNRGSDCTFAKSLRHRFPAIRAFSSPTCVSSITENRGFSPGWCGTKRPALRPLFQIVVVVCAKNPSIHPQTPIQTPCLVRNWDYCYE